MDGCKHTQIGPVCKFGPGGDFISIWPRKFLSFYERRRTMAAKLRDVLAGVMELLVGSEPSGAAAEHGPATSSAGQHICGFVANDYGPAEPGMAGITRSTGRLQTQTLLFADDFRAAGAGGHKPGRRIRAYRRAAKKKIHLKFSHQATLFEADRKGAKTA